MSAECAPPLGNERYRLIDVLGQGGMAIVYRAHDTLLDLPRAIKVMSPEIAARFLLRERFLGEARTLARLDHGNVVRLYDAGIDGDRYFMVMEMVEGGTLFESVDRDGPLPAAQACASILPVLDALEAAHALGVVHRDIKPHNVLIAANGTLKLADFGIASVPHDDPHLTKTGMVMGTIAYMAPEQRAGARLADERSDLYSVACMLFYLLTGEEPHDLFANEVREEGLRKAPPELAPWFRKGSAYKKEERYASAAEMRAALSDAMERMAGSRSAPTVASELPAAQAPPPADAPARTGLKTLVPEEAPPAPRAPIPSVKTDELRPPPVERKTTDSKPAVPPPKKLGANLKLKTGETARTPAGGTKGSAPVRRHRSSPSLNGDHAFARAVQFAWDWALTAGLIAALAWAAWTFREPLLRLFD